LLIFFLVELETLHKNGVVHRNVSPSNLLISDSGGHIIDYDHSKVGFVKREVAVKETQTEDVIKIATGILGDEWEAETYVNRLKWLWEIRDRPATREDFDWPEVDYRSSHWPRKPLR
jgi:serine/threonine protein kinase